MIFCPNCGAGCAGFRFCGTCGLDLSSYDTAAPASPSKSKGTAAAKPADPSTLLAPFESFLNADGRTYTIVSLKDKSVKELRIPLCVSVIRASAFSGCDQLFSVFIPNSVVNIERNAFMNCLSLSSLILSESISEINNEVFDGCTALTNIRAPLRIKRKIK